MNGRSASKVLPALLVGALGCAALSPGPSCPEGFETAAEARGVELPCEILRDPGRLVELAEAAYHAGDPLTAYQDLALVHILHPGSPEDPQVFPVAARLFRRFHFRTRTRPDSIWVTSEPRFMFAWLESFFQDAEEFPQEQVDALLINVHGGLYREFLAYARTRPALAGWEFSARDDNGIVREVAGRRLEDQGSQAGAAE